MSDSKSRLKSLLPGTVVFGSLNITSGRQHIASLRRLILARKAVACFPPQKRLSNRLLRLREMKSTEWSAEALTFFISRLARFTLVSFFLVPTSALYQS